MDTTNPEFVPGQTSGRRLDPQTYFAERLAVDVPEQTLQLQNVSVYLADIAVQNPEFYPRTTRPSVMARERMRYDVFNRRILEAGARDRWLNATVMQRGVDELFARVPSLIEPIKATPSRCISNRDSRNGDYYLMVHFDAATVAALAAEQAGVLTALQAMTGLQLEYRKKLRTEMLLAFIGHQTMTNQSVKVVRDTVNDMLTSDFTLAAVRRPKPPRLQK